MRIDAFQWFLARRKHFTLGVTVGLFLLVFIVNVIGERDGRLENVDKTEITDRIHRRHSLDDDELHDEEILSAVVKSLNDWNKNNKAKNRLHHSHRVKRDEEIICYGELGCFRDEGPFDYLDMLPSPPEEISTKFLFFTRKNLQNAQIFSYFNFTTMYGTTHFNSSHPTKVIIHGFGSTCQRMWAYEMHLALLQVVEANVICVDWENGAALPNYVRAAVNTRLVGKQVALLIFWLNENLGTRTEDFHLIGFSLGAHVAGFTGQELQNLSRITGLDPAGPLFESYDKKVRLDSSDALFVDVIHSNGDSLLMGGLGSWEPMGHVDFYPNGGRVQKGCSNLFLGAVRDFLWSASDGDGRSLCNHRRAYKFFTESLSNRCRFPAFSCDSYDKFLTGSCFTWDNTRCGDMGYYADRLPNPKKGLLYLITRDDEPFCANQFRITVESSPSSASISTYGGLEAILIGHDYINETFLITQSLKDNMVAGNVIQRMIVAHPAITEPIQIQLKYTAYQGWLYSGISRWSMDSLILTNAYGKSMSFCTRILLPSGIPVTIRLTAGVCLNRFPPLGVATNALGRPVFPVHHYDTYPTQVSEMNTSPVNVENITNPTQPSTFDNMEFDIPMKPPPMNVMQNSNSNSGEIGPPYNMVTDVDWSNWQPLPNSQFRPVSSLGSTLHNMHMGMGTPVEVYPPLDEESAPEGVRIEPELELNSLNNNNANVNQSVDLPPNNQEPVVIRICNILSKANDSTARNGTTSTPGGQELSCVNPELISSVENITTTTVSNNDTFQNNGAESLINKDTASGANMEQQALQSNILVIQTSPTSTDISIPSESFWKAMHNNTLYQSNGFPQYQGADPDVFLPPHLSYILQQLESQGLGPKVSTLNPHLMNSHSSNGMASNTINKNQLRHFGGIALPQLARVQMSAAGPNNHRGMIASSRALKHRPVSLSNRRQSKLLDVAGPGSMIGGQIDTMASNHQQEKVTTLHHMHGLNPHLTHYSRPIPPSSMLSATNTQTLITQVAQGPVRMTQVGQNSIHISNSPQIPVHISQESSIQKPYVRNIPPPPSFRTTGLLSPSSISNTNNINNNKQLSSNPIFYVTSQPKGYYLMPHYSYTNDHANLAGRFKLRRIPSSPSALLSVSGSVPGAVVNPTNIVSTNTNPNGVNNLNNFNNNGNFYEEQQNRLRNLQNKLIRPTTSLIPNRTS